MKLLILPILFISLSFISCGRKVANMEKRLERESRLQLTDKADNVMSAEEINVENVFQKISFNFINRRSKRKIQPICRGIEGCLRVCEYFEHSKCKQLSVNQVISFWLNQISSYNRWEQAQSDLKLIATESNVSDFLQIVDEDNQVVQALFHLNTSANCPVSGDQDVLFSFTPSASLYLREVASSEVAAEASPSAEASTVAAVEDSLGASPASGSAEAAVASPASGSAEAAVVGASPEASAVAEAAVASPDNEEASPSAAEASASEGASVDTEEVSFDSEEGSVGSVGGSEEIRVNTQPSRKKIVDGSVIPFNLQVFAGFIKQCFGYNTRTFSEVAMEIENKKAFEIGHQVISKACGGNNECIRLAYCSINSELVWNQLPSNMKDMGCEYDSFTEMLP